MGYHMKKIVRVLTAVLIFTMPIISFADTKTMTCPNALSTYMQTSVCIPKLSGKLSSDMIVTLSWEAAKNANSYEVYRASGSGSFVKVGTTSSLSYTDTKYDPRNSISYKVRGIKGSEKGDFSGALTLNPQNRTVERTIRKSYPITTCRTCGEDITDAYENKELEKPHYYTFYCATCGLNKVSSHSESEIDKHVRDVHNGDPDEDTYVFEGVRRNTTKEYKTYTLTDKHTHTWVPVYEGNTLKGYKCSHTSDVDGTACDATTEFTDNADASRDDNTMTVEEATKEYDAAKKAYDNGAVKFIDSVSGKDYFYDYSIDNQLEKLKESSNEMLNVSYEQQGSHLKEQFSFEMLRWEADLLDECNKRRLADKNFPSEVPLKLDPQFVAAAMTGAMVNYVQEHYDHVMMNKHDLSVVYPLTAAENLAQTGKENPLEGWYDAELPKYNDGNRVKEDIGHYIAITKNRVNGGVTGFGAFRDKNREEKGENVRYCYIQLLSPENTYATIKQGSFTPDPVYKQYTSDEWRKAVDEYEAPLKERLDAAEKALKEAKEAAGITDDKDNTGKEDENNPGGNTGKDDTDKPSSGDTGKDTPSEKPEVKYTNIDSIKLSVAKYIYDGKVKSPAVSVYSNGKKMDKTGYTVRYSSGRKNIGTYTVNVTGLQENGYTGSKSATFQIVPKTLKTPSVKAGKKKVDIKWTKVSGGVKYQIAIAKKGNKYKYHSVSGSKKTIKKLAKGKKYTIRVRAYKKVGSKTYYGSWSKTTAVKVK